MTTRLPTLHEALQSARRKADLTQSELADKVGCSQSAISMFEGGHRDALAREKVAEIASALGVDIKSFPREAEDAVPSNAVLKYCPIGGCPTQEPYRVMDRICFRPLLVRAPASERTHCAECGELMEQRCPNAKCHAPVAAGGFCRACGTPYVTGEQAGVGASEDGLQERAGRARALRVEREMESGEAGGLPESASNRSAGRKGRR